MGASLSEAAQYRGLGLPAALVLLPFEAQTMVLGGPTADMIR
jgi:hypothetical protein